jgi:HTH-type transcriptional regulator, sugar sensing transcriptional regulator
MQTFKYSLYYTYYSNMEIQNLLEEIGLTKQEAKCYLAIYQLKESKAGRLSKESGIATSNIYPVIDSLIKKGLISYKIKNNVRIFFPAPINSINNLIEEKQKRLNEQKDQAQKAILGLKTSKGTQTISDYKYFEGISGIKSLWTEILNYMETSKEKLTLEIYATPLEHYDYLLGFYNEFHRIRRKLKIPYKLIANTEDKNLVQMRKKEGAEVKTGNTKNEAEMGCIGDYYITQTNTGKKPYGILIKDRKMADTFSQIFETLWKQAK